MPAEVSARGCHGEDAGVVRVFRGRGQEHQAGLVPDRLRDPQPVHPGLLLAQPDAAEPPEQAGQLHGEPGHELRAAAAERPLTRSRKPVHRRSLRNRAVGVLMEEVLVIFKQSHCILQREVFLITIIISSSRNITNISIDLSDLILYYYCSIIVSAINVQISTSDEAIISYSGDIVAAILNITNIFSLSIFRTV